MKKTTLFLVVAVFSSTLYAQEGVIWKKINRPKSSISNKNENSEYNKDQLFFELNPIALKKALTDGKIAKTAGITISIPNSKGTLEQFSVLECSNFAPELQAKYPEITAYKGVGVTDRNASLSFSLSPNGLQTMVLRAASESEFMEPFSGGDNIYVFSESRSRKIGELPFLCKTQDVAIGKKLLPKVGKTSASNGVFKTFRLALSCTGEYTTYHGGTVEGALAAMNATMTRVNGIFNRDLAVKLEIIANNTAIIYTNPATDPYSDGREGATGLWNLELQENLTAVITNNNYDIGHLFGASGGGGNAGCIGCVCEDPTAEEKLGKGSAYTSPSNEKPEGDAFDVDFVAHEIGHQLGANHTYSHEIEDEGVNVEPGSGSTIMGYAGITDYNVQPNSDDYFSYASIFQIQKNIAPRTCPVSTPILGTPSVSAGLDYTIPSGTAFVLKGKGSSASGNTLSYCWEQNDSAGNENVGEKSMAFLLKTDGPLFRSIKPAATAVRFMPDFGSVLKNNLSSSWESVSTISRALHFVLTVRDNGVQGKAQTNSDEMIVNVNQAIGPFALTSQSKPDIGLVKGANETITWSVNGSNTLIGSATVNIKLSTDGGLTFPIILASKTANDGSETIVVPDVLSSDCRILIEPTENIYYAINKESFAIGYKITTATNTYPFVAPFDIPEATNYIEKTIIVPVILQSSGVPIEQNESLSSLTISDVNLSIGLTHTYLSDVEMEIVSPKGTVVKLFNKSCGSTSGSLLLDYDDSGKELDCDLTKTQITTPFGSLAAFNGESPAGIWTLRVRDAFPGAVGRIDSASITIYTKSTTIDTTSVIKLRKDDFLAIPNPSSGNFTIQFKERSKNNVKIAINDLLGQNVFNKELMPSENLDEKIELNNVQLGVYLLSIIDGDKRTVKKIVIE